ncbi:MAG TPA: hypothetical protein VEI06_16570 [Gemmatimonadaceae bacterium]|nr:hypothetical protein [Gemmatimonadaceae bacterium]
MTGSEHKSGSKKSRIEEELKLIGFVTLYVFVTLTALDIYRALACSGTMLGGLKVGYNLIEALVIAKVIIIGDLFKVSHHFHDRPLAVPTLYRAFIFAIFVLLFSSLELFIEGLVHGESISIAMDEVLSKERGVRAAHAAMMFLAGIPLFATWELGRRLGEGRLLHLFFADRPVG